MRRMYSENQLAKIIADNVGKATSLLDGSIVLDEETGQVLISSLINIPEMIIEGTGFAGIKDEDENTLQDALDGKQDKLYIHQLSLSDADDLSLFNLKVINNSSDEITLSTFMNNVRKIIEYDNQYVDVNETMYIFMRAEFHIANNKLIATVDVYDNTNNGFITLPEYEITAISDIPTPL